MSYSNGKISETNISYSDVKSAIGASSNDIGTLCKHSGINKWSAHKPISVKANSLGINDMKNYNYGLTPVTGALSFIITAMKSASTRNWVYTKPSGGENSPYRIGDFRLYNSQAGSPFRSFGAESVNTDSIPSGQDFVMQIYVGQNNSDNTQIHLSDMGSGGSAVSTFYPAVIVTNRSWSHIGTYVCDKTCAQLAGSPANITLNLSTAEYYFIAVLANAKNSPTSFLTLEFEPIAATVQQTVYTSSASLAASCFLSGGVVTMTATFTTVCGANDNGRRPLTFKDFKVSFGNASTIEQYTYYGQITTTQTVVQNTTSKYVSVTFTGTTTNQQLVQMLQNEQTVYAKGWYTIVRSNPAATSTGNVTERVIAY